MKYRYFKTEHDDKPLIIMDEENDLFRYVTPEDSVSQQREWHKLGSDGFKKFIFRCWVEISEKDVFVEML